MLVMAALERRDTILARLAHCLPQVHVVTLDNVLDAILHATRRPPDLLLLDHAIDGAAAPALISNLSRVSPRTDVLVFDELAGSASTGGGTVRRWDDLTSAVRQWLADRGADGQGA